MVTQGVYRDHRFTGTRCFAAGFPSTGTVRMRFSYVSSLLRVEGDRPSTGKAAVLRGDEEAGSATRAPPSAAERQTLFQS